MDKELSWEEIQEAVKALSPELQERLYYALIDHSLLNSNEMLQALEEFHSGNLTEI